MTENTWQPINTAPVEGWFLAYNLKHTWRDGVAPVVVLERTIDGTFREPHSGNKPTNLTHWMPLPELPELLTPQEDNVLGEIAGDTCGSKGCLGELLVCRHTKDTYCPECERVIGE